MLDSTQDTEGVIRVSLRVQNALVGHGLRAVLARHDDVSVSSEEGLQPVLAGRSGGRLDSVVTVIDAASLKSLSSKEFCVLVISDSPNYMLLYAIKQGVRGIVAES